MTTNTKTACDFFRDFFGEVYQDSDVVFVKGKLKARQISDNPFPFSWQSLVALADEWEKCRDEDGLCTALQNFLRANNLSSGSQTGREGAIAALKTAMAQRPFDPVRRIFEQKGRPLASCDSRQPEFDLAEQLFGLFDGSKSDGFDQSREFSNTDESKIAAVRGLLLLRGWVEHYAQNDDELDRLHKELPRFRVHMFFRAIAGVWASACTAAEYQARKSYVKKLFPRPQI
ncbi:MAG: hypothetical protein RMM53_12625, partial [Bacteroidia bacterium]|nr:hypothetical protein [Bacteroidia bacterium]